MHRETDFTKGPIAGPLLRFCLPILLALFLQALYGAVDLIIVGKYAVAADVSGVAVGSQLMMTITGLVSSFSMGTTILLGQKLGEGDRDALGRIVGTSILLFLGAGVLLTVLVPLLSGSLVRLMNAPAEAFDETRRYLSICGAGYVMIVAYNVLGSVMRGMGDSKTPLITVAVASACNIVGDLILVARFHMGAAGAALATVLSQTVSVIFSFLLLRRGGLPFSFGRRDVRLHGPILRRIAVYGAPIALQDLLVGLSFLIILAIVNRLGLIASAGVGVAEKVCAFIMLLPLAFMQAMSAYVAQNHGAGKDERAVRGLKIAIGLSTLFGVSMFYLAYFHGDLLAGLFSNDEAVVAAGFDYLRAYAIDCLFTCFLFCFIGFFNGLGHTGFVMAQGILSAFLVRVPVAWYMARTTGKLFFIGLSVPCSTVAEIAACFLFYAYIQKRQRRRLALKDS